MAFFLHGSPGTSAVQTILPVGAVIPYAGPLTDPKCTNALEALGWLNCDGRKLSTDHYCELYAVIADFYGGNNDMFRLPDYRGLFLRAVAENNEQDPGIDLRTGPNGGQSRAVGTTQMEMVQTHQHNYNNYPALPPGFTPDDSPPFNNVTPVLSRTQGLFAGGMGSPALGGEETRPKNIYINYLIRWTAAAGCSAIPGQVWQR